MPAERSLFQRTFLIPNMCDHAHVLAAAMHAFGIEAEVLPPSDESTADLGARAMLGRECLPCLLVVGDLLARARRPDFDPSHYALFLSTSNGPCRYGQYTTLYRQVLDEHGLAAMEVLAPNQANSYMGFGDNPTALRRLAWEGVVAVDLLQQILHHIRPYELRAGESDAIYRTALASVLAVLRGGNRPEAVLRECGDAFEGVAVDRSRPRPLIAVVGEVYVRQNHFANRRLNQTLEALGAEVTVAPMMEWFYYTNWLLEQHSRALGKSVGGLLTWLTDAYQHRRERALRAPLAHLLPYPPEPSAGRLVDAMRPYANAALECETVMTLGRAVDFAHAGADGIINIMPFSCMAGILAAGLAGPLRRDHDSIPWLDLSMDLQGTTNLQTRLEAFVHQAAHRHARRLAPAA